MYEFQFDDKGFEWLDYSDRENSVMLYMRKGWRSHDTLVIACNFTPAVRHDYRVGIPTKGTWKEIFNSDNIKYGGSGVLNQGLFATKPVKYHGRDYSFAITLPPLGVTILKLNEEEAGFTLAS